jgi:hypothetical protein
MFTRATVCFAATVCGTIAFAGGGDDATIFPSHPQQVPVMTGGWDAGVVIVRHPGSHVEGWHGGWQPGGYEGRIGRPYYYSVGPEGAGTYGPQVAPRPAGCDTSSGLGWGGWWGSGDVYNYHFGPGFYRHSEYGHVRFPYYSYRRPWYFPGHPVYNRDTNFAW